MISFMTAFGAIALASGGLSYYNLPGGIKMALSESVNLKENGFVYPIFADPPFNAISNFYIYEVLNPK